MKLGTTQIESGSDSSAVRRDAAGVPTAFRLLKPGVNSLTVDGQIREGQLTSAELQKILDYAALKGELIPVDCEHLLFLLAQLNKVDEGDLMKTEPALGEMAAVGAVALVGENGEIWADCKKWTARARELLTTAGDKMYLYFSPVVRGLTGKEGPLRITSIGLTNTPAFNNLDALAASAEIGFGATRALFSVQQTNNQEKQVVKDLILKLAALVGLDAVALSAEGASLQPLLTALSGKLETLQGDAGKFIAGVKDAIGLKDGQGLDVAAGLIVSLAAARQSDAAALTDARSKITAFETEGKTRLITDLTAAGKLTAAMQKSPWFTGLDFAALKSWGDCAPVVVQPGRVTETGIVREAPGANVMTPAMITIARNCGQKPEDVAKTNGLVMPTA